MDSKQPHRPDAAGRPPPPLPPRQNPSALPADSPPPYDAISDPEEVTLDHTWTSRDPRSTSQQSLTPSDSNPQNSRRKLLCIYIHGFMGNETSFRSFPAHVHNLLTVLLAETHVVHTKIYPRYRSKRNITFARNDFSKWLEPHEDGKTDIVLLGHSMGGLISAEVVLMPPDPPASRPLKHRIVGSINFDVPFLGMHPGVVKSGLASIFSSPTDPPADKYETTSLQAGDGAPATPSPIASPSPVAPADTFWGSQDPNYNPNFQNDVVLPVRKGWRSAWHFVNKHSDSLGKATKQLVTSHLEFGGAMANYGELKARYARLRALEEDDVSVRKSIATGNVAPPRVRFVNYYTASTGRPKKPKSPGPEGPSETPEGVGSKASLEVAPESSSRPTGGASGHKRSPSPIISLQEHTNDDAVQVKSPVVPSDEDDDFHSVGEDAPLTDMSHVDPMPEPMSENDEDGVRDETEGTGVEGRTMSHTSSLSLTASLPPVPEPPARPPPLDTSYVQDKETRKLMEREHARATKSYEKAVKDRERIIKDRAKLEEKRAKKERKGSEREAKDAEKVAKKERERKEKKKRKEGDKAAKEEGRELTHSEREALRQEGERKRMEAEGRRLRGEPDPPPDTEPASPQDSTLSPPSSPDPAPKSPPTIPSEKPTVDPLASFPSNPSSSNPPNPAPTKSKQEKEPKDRNFCALPPADSSGARDPAWVRVFMKDVDEVGAHCGLFFVDGRYEMLVGDTAERVVGWVRGEN